jgi:hypothetical protein
LQNIQNGNGPKWKMFIQVMTDKEADELDFDPFDLTKVWPHKEFPLHEVCRHQTLHSAHLCFVPHRGVFVSDRKKETLRLRDINAGMIIAVLFTPRLKALISKSCFQIVVHRQLIDDRSLRSG